jgi:hypothetical protein
MTDSDECYSLLWYRINYDNKRLRDTNARVKFTHSDEWSSLLQYIISYDHKRLQDTSARVKFTDSKLKLTAAQ